MTNSTDSAVSNPYVGPRTFTEKEGRFFFGREREAKFEVFWGTLEEYAQQELRSP